MAQSLGKYDEAESCYQGSLAMYRAAKSVIGEADALYQLGGVCHLQGRVTESRMKLKKSIALARRVRDQESVAVSLQLLTALATLERMTVGAMDATAHQQGNCGTRVPIRA
jgi:tetratricopeptide (TPR) repeat protein